MTCWCANMPPNSVGWAVWASFGFTFVGWLLAAAVVVGLSGVFKRD